MKCIRELEAMTENEKPLRIWDEDPVFNDWFKRLRIIVIKFPGYELMMVRSRYGRTCYYKGPIMPLEFVKFLTWGKCPGQQYKL